MVVREIPAEYYWINREVDYLANCADNISYTARERTGKKPTAADRDHFKSIQTAVESAISRLPPPESNGVQALKNRFRSITLSFDSRYREAVA